MVEALTLTTADGIALDAELAIADAATAAMVVCHPHPRFGGTMRSLVVSALFEALPRAGVTCLRFDFRGVGRSGGIHDDGRAERLDATAAVHELARRSPSAPIVLAGWSFGADVALSVRDDAVAAWLAIACPLRSAIDVAATGRDARPKLVVLAEHDEVRDAESIAAAVNGWTSTRVETVAGASHFFVGRTDRLVQLAANYVATLAG